MSNLSEAISEMRTMRESYDQIGAAAEAYNVGKTQLAAAITSKGVETSPTETYPEMAEKVNAISQETYEINGGEMYAKQLFGSLETPNYWNLYEVLAQLLSDGRLVNYGGILLAEYYRGYDSLVLSGAGAGGAYVVSDKDENDQFKMYTEDTTHVWDTEFDGKGSRWVAYCFADEYHDFQITDTDTSPRSIFIGRKAGTISCLTNTRTSKIIVPDGNELRYYSCGTYAQNWDKNLVFRNMGYGTNSINLKQQSINSVYIESDTFGGETGYPIYVGTLLESVVIKANTIGKRIINAENYDKRINNVILEANSIDNSNDILISSYQSGDIRYVALIAEYIQLTRVRYGANGDIDTLYLGYLTNEKDLTASIGYGGNTKRVILQNGWCKTLSIGGFTSLTKADVQAYIFDRLGVNDLSTGAVTITLASAVLNLFTQEEIDAVVERTNITIVGA